MTALDERIFTKVSWYEVCFVDYCTSILTSQSDTAELGAWVEKLEIAPIVTDVSEVIDHIDVTIGPQFLNLFSEHLYSSPNKAFEELVSNSWDAGAQTVYIGMPGDLSDASAAVWVLDDGDSMDLDGLRALWLSLGLLKGKTLPGTEETKSASSV